MSDITLDSLILPPDLIWIDEYSWSNIQSNNKYTIQGKLIISESEVTKGRLITLSSNNAWIKRSDLDTLYSWMQILNKSMTLKLHDAREFNVGFRHWDKPALETENIIGTSIPGTNTEYKLSLKLVEI